MDTFCSDGDEFYTFTGDEIQRFVDVSDLMEAHLTPIGLGQRFTRDDLEQKHQLETIPEIIFDVLDASTGFA